MLARPSPRFPRPEGRLSGETRVTVSPSACQPASRRLHARVGRRVVGEILLRRSGSARTQSYPACRPRRSVPSSCAELRTVSPTFNFNVALDAYGPIREATPCETTVGVSREITLGGWAGVCRPPALPCVRISAAHKPSTGGTTRRDTATSTRKRSYDHNAWSSSINPASRGRSWHSREARRSRRRPDRPPPTELGEAAVPLCECPEQAPMRDRKPRLPEHSLCRARSPNSLEYVLGAAVALPSAGRGFPAQARAEQHRRACRFG